MAGRWRWSRRDSPTGPCAARVWHRRAPSLKLCAMAAQRRNAKKQDSAPSTPSRPRRFARAADLGLTPREHRILARLDTPQKIQAFLNAIPCNHEIGGETVLSVREVLPQRRAHCIEGAMVAAAALWVNGYPPLLMHLDCHL